MASVLDEHGFPFKGLTPANFRGEIQGKSVRVVSATADTEPRQIAVVLDGSQTMRDTSSGKWQLAVQVAQHMLDNGPPRSTRYYATFGTGGDRPLNLRSGDLAFDPISFQDLASGLMHIGRAEKRPPLLDVVLKGFGLLPNTRLGDVVYMITDGNEEGSKIKPDDLQRRLLAAGTRLFAVTLPMNYDIELTINEPNVQSEQEATDFLNTIQITGGRAIRVRPNRRANQWGFHFDDREKMDLATTLQLMYLQMAHFYSVEIELPKPMPGAESWKLEVVPPQGVKKNSLVLFYPRKIAACAPSVN